ncbi:MAG: hypothetical protein P4L65_01865 [Legionella sp.]|nr:hypothetical protein [Legionella sp.]
MRKSTVSIKKHGFFSQTQDNNTAYFFNEPDFDFSQLSFEFTSLYQLFLSNKLFYAKHIEMTLYLDYLCDLMLSYYQFDVNSDLKPLQKQKNEVAAFLNELEHPSIDRSSILLRERIKAHRQHSFSTFGRISEFNKRIGQFNSERSHINYSRSLAINLLNYLKNNSFIQDLNRILGDQYIFINGINLLTESRGVFALLGIVLLGFRFSINLILMGQRVWNALQEKELSVYKVFKQELEQRGFSMVSDLIWAVVGVLTTFNNFFNISSLSVSPIVLGFLMFDTLLLLAQWCYESIQYNKRLKELASQIKEATHLELLLIEQQINLLNDQWEVQCAYFALNILGANIIALSFAFTLLYVNPIILIGIALLSMLGNALYNSSEEYKKYQQSNVSVNRELANGTILSDVHHREILMKLQEERDYYYLQFLKHLGFNVGGVAFIITAAVVSWPVTLCLTSLYIGYQLYKNYQNLVEKEENKVLPHHTYRFFSSRPNENSAQDKLLEHNMENVFS